MSIQAIRTALANNVGTISGLRTSLDVPDQINVPMAIVQLDDISYDQAFKGGLSQYNFTVTVFVGRASERTAQRKLDEYAFTTNGIKSAVESDKTLNGNAFDVRVVEMSNIGTVSLGEVSYLTADFRINVFAD
jgi:hypothetical protein